MGERCPITELRGGSVSVMAGGATGPVATGWNSIVGVGGDVRPGNEGTPLQEVRIRLMSRRQFRVSAKRVFIIKPQ